MLAKLRIFSKGGVEALPLLTIACNISLFRQHSLSTRAGRTEGKAFCERIELLHRLPLEVAGIFRAELILCR